MLPITSSNSKRREIDLLFDGADFIPPHILDAVKHTLLREQNRRGFDHDTFKDLIQTCLIKTWRTLEKESKEKGPGYFVDLVRNTIIDHVRARSTRSRYEVPSYSESLGVNEIAMMDEALRQMRSKTELDEIIHSVLDDKEIAIVDMYFFQGFSLYQISIRQEVSVKTVQNRRDAAVEKLRGGFRRAVSGNLRQRASASERFGVNE